MSISARYRTLAVDSRALRKNIKTDAPELQEKVGRELAKTAEILESLFEQVGEIPQIKLEKELTPVLIKAHGTLDRCRVLLEDADEIDNAERIWDMEQRLYRLLNDL
jgi:hypothetical protein